MLHTHDNNEQEKLALQTSLAGLREQLRVKDEERQSQTQSLAAMGAVSQASSHRLSTAEKASGKKKTTGGLVRVVTLAFSPGWG